MSKNDNVPALYLKNPTVAALNQVPGFDPMKLLRRMVSPKTGEEVFRLDLQYKKLWFRLAHPQGRIRLKPLRITEQLAIYEAQIYLHREDPEAISNFTACILRSDAPNGQYVHAAQEEAVDKALTDAGFGIQLSDVSVPESKRHFGCEVPVARLQGKADDAEQAQKPDATIKPAEKRVRRAATEKPAFKKQVAISAEQPKSVEEKKQEPVVQQTEPSAKPAVVETPVKKSGADQALEILRRTAAAAPDTQMAEQIAASSAPTYTKDMPVEQIVELMTLDQAKKVVVDVGTCRGKTMEEVAARRIASVRFYLTAGYTSDNNIVRAAARIVLDNLEVKKAG